MIWRKPALYSLVVLASIVLSLFFTYLYGQFFQHDRYWKGTMHRVQETQIALINGFLDLEGAARLLAENRNQLSKVFDTVRGKLAITVESNNNIIYSNRIDSFNPQGTPQIINLGEYGLSITIDRYEPPTWSKNYISWLSRPVEWFSPRFDYITAPFLGLAFIFSSFISAFIWRYRAAHLSKDVLGILNRIGVAEE